MTAWQAFALGCFVTIAIYALLRAALWVANSRAIADPMDGVHGDQTQVER